jgi:hypothetical protein
MIYGIAAASDSVLCMTQRIDEKAAASDPGAEMRAETQALGSRVT